MVTSYKYRIYPNTEQQVFFEKSFGCSRWIYNYFLALRNKQYEETKKSSSCYELIKLITEIKKENEWLKEVSNQTLQKTVLNLDNAFQNFFRKQSKYPKFKSKKDNNQSFQFVDNVVINGNKLYVPKLKHCGIKIKLDDRYNGEKIKTTTISKTPSGEYYASFVVDTEQQELPTEQFTPETTIGIDLGIKTFATISTGEKIDNPKWFRQSEKKLAREQRRLSRKKIGSNNRNKQRIIVAKTHNKISNQRKDFIHKLTHRLTHDNQVATICIEDLAVENMGRNHKLAKSIKDAGWGMFRQLLDYKCKWYGKRLIVISRFAPSSKLCRFCGSINNKLKLQDRKWTCECGVTHDRDINAAQNIRMLGIEQYYHN